MKFISYPTQAAAIARSRAEAQTRKCGPVTTHWWDVVEGAAGDFAIRIPEKASEEVNLTTAEKGRLATTFNRKAPEAP